MDEHQTEFAPADYSDGRQKGQWKSRYPKCAWILIGVEAAYLLILLFLAPTLLAIACLGTPAKQLGLSPSQYAAALPAACGWIGGMLGGTLFDLKWLYHSVAKEIWNFDRILWRIFIPHLSAGLSFATTLLMQSGVIRVFDAEAIKSPGLAIGIGFLVGYFSDMAAAKLYEVAKTLFGTTHRDDTTRSATHTGATEKTNNAGGQG